MESGCLRRPTVSALCRACLGREADVLSTKVCRYSSVEPPDVVIRCFEIAAKSGGRHRGTFLPRLTGQYRVFCDGGDDRDDSTVNLSLSHVLSRAIDCCRGRNCLLDSRDDLDERLCGCRRFERSTWIFVRNDSRQVPGRCRCTTPAGCAVSRSSQRGREYHESF